MFTAALHAPEKKLQPLVQLLNLPQLVAHHWQRKNMHNIPDRCAAPVISMRTTA